MLQSRIITAMIALPVLLALLVFLPPEAIAVFLCAVVALSSFETTRLLYPALHEKLSGRFFSSDLDLRVDFRSYGACVVAVLIFATVVFQLAPTNAGMAVAGLLLAMLLGLFLTSEGQDPIANVLGFPFVVAYGSYPWLSVWDLYLMEPFGGYLFFGLAVVWGGDTGAYFGGKRFGRIPLAKTLSPHKTMEGAFFGIVSSIAAGLLINIFYGWSLFELAPCVLISIAAGFCGQCGDLFESSLKRFASVKDSGSIFPGHGGFLDRVDGLMIALPVVCFCLRLAGIK